MTLLCASISPVSRRTTSSALLRAQGCCVSNTRLVRLRSHAARKRNHVASGIRQAISGGVLPRSRTIALKPPFCSSRSAERMAWSSACQAPLAGLCKAEPATLADMVLVDGMLAKRRGCGSAQRGTMARLSPRRGGRRSELTCSSRSLGRVPRDRF